MGACSGYPYHDLRQVARAERLAACRQRREWHGVVIPEAEWCVPVKLCGTDGRALGTELY